MSKEIEEDIKIHNNVKQFLYWCAKNKSDPYYQVHNYDFQSGAWYSAPDMNLCEKE